MERIFDSLSKAVGNTPLLEVKGLEKEWNLKARLAVKLEGMNPAGSVKDRAAKAMIEDAERKGLLRPGSVIIEPTSGNTGIGLAAIAAARGYRVILTMPETMSVERRKLLAAYGAQLVLTEGAKGMSGAVEKAKELEKETEGSFIPDQFGNPANAQAHYETTGPEIWRDTDGKADFFVAGVGTGGTITGTGRYLKEQNPALQVIAVEPADSPLLSKGYAGSHGLQGIGANFVPSILDLDLLDEIMTVTTEQAFAACRMLAGKEGFLAGISSGAALFAAAEIAKREENAGKLVVALLPDAGDRYLSTALFGD